MVESWQYPDRYIATTCSEHMARRNQFKEEFMGLMDKLFGSTPDYPPLDKEDPAAQKLEDLREPVEKLVTELNDTIEVVPGDETAFFFIGKPPKKFGVAWVGQDGKVVNFKSLVEEKGLSVISLEKLSDRLKEIYIKHQEEPRYTMTVSDKTIVVTPSPELRGDIKQVIDDTV
jgi:hypothetical protein